MALRKPIVVSSGRPQQLQSADDLEASNLDAGFAVCGRLTPTSGSPFATSSDFTTIYFTPHEGNRIKLYNGTYWKFHAFSEASIAVPSTIYRLFDIFGYDNSGTFTLETANWSQTTGSITNATNASPIVVTSTSHGLANGDFVGIAGVGGNTAANNVWKVANVTTDTFELEYSTGNGAYTGGGTWYKITGVSSSNLTTQNGIYVKSGETNKRYLGIGMTTGTSGHCRTDTTLAWLVNAYNQQFLRLSYFEATSHTYASSTFRSWNGDGTAYRSFLTPSNADQLVAGTLTPQMNGDATALPNVQIAIGPSGANICNVGTGTTTSFRCSSSDWLSRSAGFSIAHPQESVFNTGTATYTQIIMRLRVAQ